MTLVKKPGPRMRPIASQDQAHISTKMQFLNMDLRWSLVMALDPG